MNDYKFNVEDKKDQVIILIFLVCLVIFSFYNAYKFSQMPKYNVKCVAPGGIEELSTDNYSEALTFVKKCEDKMMLPTPAWEKPLDNYFNDS